MSTALPILYINGLGNGSIGAKDKLAQLWWRRAGAEFHCAQINWYDDRTFEDHLTEVVAKADKLLAQSGRVVVIGASAGGSLALNTFFRLRDKNICAVNAHGRLRKGNYTNRNSLYRRARLGTGKPSQSFYDSVMYTEREILPNVTTSDRRRLLVLSQLTDLVVPTELMSIEGVQEHRSLAFGHSGGFWAHMFADRDLIIDFANNVLQ